MPSGSDFGATNNSATPTPVCPRHPDRVAYVRCQRCNEPTCPDCQHPVEVGILCTGCVQQAQRSMPREHRPAKFVDRHGYPIPITTYTLIGLCVLIYIGQWATQTIPGVPSVTELAQFAGLYVSEIALNTSVPSVSFEPWRMISSAFVHSLSNPLHLILNMVVLWMVGRVLEPALGWARYLAVYLLSAVGGAVAVLWLSAPQVPVVGASGAVYGLFATLFVVMRAQRAQTNGLLVLIGINLAFSFLVPGISWQGHLGGLITGGIAALIIRGLSQPPKNQPMTPAIRKRGRRLSWWGLVGLALVLVVFTVVGAAQITVDSLVR